MDWFRLWALRGHWGLARVSQEAWSHFQRGGKEKATPLVLTSPELSATPPQVLPLPCTTPICPWCHHRGRQLLWLQCNCHPPSLPGREHDCRRHCLHLLSRCGEGPGWGQEELGPEFSEGPWGPRPPKQFLRPVEPAVVSSQLYVVQRWPQPFW